MNGARNTLVVAGVAWAALGLAGTAPAESLAAGEALPETLDLLARKLEAILPGTDCWFLLRDPATGVLRPQAAGVHPVCLSAAQRCAERVVRERTPYRGRFDASDVTVPAAPGEEGRMPAPALILPLVHGDISLGTLQVCHPQPDAFREHDQDLLECIADRIAPAVYKGLRGEPEGLPRAA